MDMELHTLQILLLTAINCHANAKQNITNMGISKNYSDYFVKDIFEKKIDE